SGERSDCKHHRHFIQFLHGSPLGEKAAAALRIKDALSDHHPKRWGDCAIGSLANSPWDGPET
ncbi:MAG: hypothetical protein ABWY10_05875, partial [Tardiphaga sp.]